MEKSKDSNINSTKRDDLSYWKLCHHIKHTLFSLWLEYEAIWTNIVSLIESFLIKLHHGTQFFNHFQGTWGYILIIHIAKNHHHFNQEIHEYVIKKYSLNRLFHICNGHQSSVLRVILGWDMFLCTPTMNGPTTLTSYFVTTSSTTTLPT